MSMKNAAEVGTACPPKARPRNRLKELELEQEAARVALRNAEEELQKARQEVEEERQAKKDMEEVMAELKESMAVLEKENSHLLEQLIEAKASVLSSPVPTGVKEEGGATADEPVADAECVTISDSDSGSSSSAESSENDWERNCENPGEGMDCHAPAEGDGEGSTEEGGGARAEACNGSYPGEPLEQPGGQPGDGGRERSRSPRWSPGSGSAWAPRSPSAELEEAAAEEGSAAAESFAGNPRTNFGIFDLNFIRREAAKARNWDPTECPAENKDYPRVEVPVVQLKFTHNNVGGTFKHGEHQRQPIQSLTDSLVHGHVTAKDLPPMVVFRKEHTELWVIMGNRRLKALKDAARILNRPVLANCIIHDVPWLPLVCKFLLAKTTDNGGQDASLRRGQRRRRPRRNGTRPAQPLAAAGQEPPWHFRGAGGYGR